MKRKRSGGDKRLKKNKKQATNTLSPSDRIPKELKILIVGIVLDSCRKTFNDWSAISLVSKEWNEVAWQAFYKTVSLEIKNLIFIKACRKGRFHSAQKIIEQDTFIAYNNKVDPSADDNAAIKQASGKGRVDVVRLLLQDVRVNPSAHNNCAIKWSSENGRTDVVKLLLQDVRVDPSVDSNFPIAYASREGYVDVVKLLLQDPRVDPSDADNYAITYGSQEGHVDVVKLLLKDNRVNSYDQENKEIQQTSENGGTEVVKNLLKEEKVEQ